MEVDALVNEVKELRKDGRGTEAARVQAENRGLLSLKGAAADIRDDLSAVRKRIRAVRDNDRMGWAERRRTLQELDKRRRDIAERFNRLYVERVAEPAQRDRALIPVD